MILSASAFLLVIAAIVIVATGAYTVEQQDRAVIERFGKFARVAGPGLNVKVSVIEQVATPPSSPHRPR